MVDTVSCKARRTLEHSVLNPIANLVLGAVLGAVDGMVVPALVKFFRTTQTEAQDIAMALVLPGALVALFTYGHAGHVDCGIGVPLALDQRVAPRRAACGCLSIPVRYRRGQSAATLSEPHASGHPCSTQAFICLTK